MNDRRPRLSIPLGTPPRAAQVLRSVCGAVAATPVATVSPTVLTDVADIRTANLLWLHFSKWLLADLFFGVLAILLAVLHIVRRTRPLLLHALFRIIALLLAAIDSHSARRREPTGSRSGAVSGTSAIRCCFD
jgi:hypothetical protein